MKTIIDSHSIYNDKNSGYERFARAVLPALAANHDRKCFSVGRGSLARGLNFAPLFAVTGKHKVLFPTNPPLFWVRSFLKNVVFIVHDIFPLERPDLCQKATSETYGHFLGDVLEKGTVVAVSKFTSLEIGRFFSISPVPVIGNFVETRKKLDISAQECQDLKAKYGRFFLAVGTIEPRKNYPYLIREYKKYRENNGEPLNLVIFGRRGWEQQSTVDSFFSTPGVHWIPDGSDDLLWAAYSEAECIVSTSHYEGFNMPVFEGLALGTPAILPKGSAPTHEFDGFITYRLEPGALAKILMDFARKDINLERIENFEAFDVSHYTAAAVSEKLTPFLEG